jgi:hypothetical protein
VESGISFKASAAVDGAPIFASRWVMHFAYSTHGFCITVAGRLNISTGILAVRVSDSLASPLQPYAFFAPNRCISQMYPTG